jgi:hypothetical protein
MFIFGSSGSGLITYESPSGIDPAPRDMRI